MSRLAFYLIVGFLLVVGIAASIHRHVQFEIPWTPGEQRQVWEIEAVITFNAQDGPVQVDLALPSHQAGYRVLTENTASSGYGLAYSADELGRQAQWTIRNAAGSQQLYYSVQMLVSPEARAPIQTPPGLSTPTPWGAPYDSAAEQIIERAWARSADNATFARELILDLNGERQAENARLLLSQETPTALIVRLLNQAGVQAREISGLMLEDARRRQSLTSWIQVFDETGEQWTVFNPRTGERGRPDNLLLWETGGRAVLEVQGGTNSQVSFSMLTHNQPASAAVRNHRSDSTLLNFSIHSLPLEEQALFQTILLIPIGALVVVLLRVFIGVKTSGTFMPVLIALAFIQTTLLTGLIGFLLIVAVGLVIRNYLSHLNLLLVARVSAVIITVIAIIAAFTVLAYRMGLSAGLTVTFFPMIILAWTIERMSILWEEEGPKQVLIQGGGSLVTAVLAYLAMNNPWIRHITFNFLGVQLILMAFILMLGNYTGYRLLELRRFKPIIDDEKPS
ncbi:MULTISPECIES: inactive transglutaminase family protein [unclassified Halomonas]|uniref:inactive transglutaminase family protein n=1 Tax=unclassified Halomonas TaxID=2609666 RepID=UPI0021E4C4BB|nr:MULTISPECIES: inactive transglutaminase family protein [unclassified Halomonas]UYF98375.1 inactive transglutaminase family protein [Halomonas sp. GD1P12]WNL40502.1 inactive transglutaminase family protein [Halomonas sp. PAMB 3232]WNL43832.1 inactive transglutaminase family protein [Halomonas sp. PAMB 3264]